MNEEEIRLQQTKKVFDTIAKLIAGNESCSYRYLIYDLLGFKEDAYCELISGLAITNMLVDYQEVKKQKDDVVEFIKEYHNYENRFKWCEQNYIDTINEIERMLGETNVED